MSSTDDKGNNITNAVKVLKETYKNLNLLFVELDRVGERSGYVSITPKFLRWQSDADCDGWLTNDFIKLYQLKSDPDLHHIEGMKDGLVYGIEVDLDTYEYPVIALNIYDFDLSAWKNLSVSDHWKYWDPFRYIDYFDIDEKGMTSSSKTKEKYVSRYSGLQRSISKSMPLLSISSPEDIKTLIFEGFKDVHFQN
jgi:hypothetical protein